MTITPERLAELVGEAKERGSEECVVVDSYQLPDSYSGKWVRIVVSVPLPCHFSEIAHLRGSGMDLLAELLLREATLPLHAGGEAHWREHYRRVCAANNEWQARVADLSAENARLREALGGLIDVAEKAEDQFAMYARLHAAKGTPEADKKCESNRLWALRISSALVTATAALKGPST